MKLIPYGLDRFKPEIASLVFVEDESDCWTLWAFHFQALGVPGSGATSTIQPEHLDGAAIAYVVEEPDQGGQRFIEGMQKRLSETGEADLLVVVRLGADVNDYYKKNRADFARRFQTALDDFTYKALADLPPGEYDRFY